MKISSWRAVGTTLELYFNAVLPAMKRFYLVLLLLLASAWPLVNFAVAQTNWRPFRPGLIYVFRTAKADSIFTLRVDSLSVKGLDSVYHFNRTLRVLQGRHYYPTTNNLFGARMQFRPGTGTYTFLLDADVQGSAREWTLQSGIKAGNSYSQPVGPATTTSALSKQLQTVSAAITDTVLTLRTAPDNDSMVFSRSYGALQLPRSLYGSAYGSRPLYMAELPVPISQSRYYSATQLFDYQPGDEFGYKSSETLFTPFPCSENLVLRRILTREQTADSLVYTYMAQGHYRTLSIGAPGCSATPVNTISPITRGRLAISLRTGRSPQLRALGLFTLEPKAVSRQEETGISAVVAGLPIVNRVAGGCANAGPSIGNTFLVRRLGFGAGPGEFGVGADIGCEQHFAAGVGEASSCQQYLACARRHPGTQISVCGSCDDFSTLLPVRTAQAATVSLHPNPAAEAATLTLTAPAQPGMRLLLRDALGRTIWQTAVGTGQTTVPVSLRGQPAGMYLLQIDWAQAAPVSMRLVKE
jgi:hypothetical protein